MSRLAVPVTGTTGPAGLLCSRLCRPLRAIPAFPSVPFTVRSLARPYVLDSSPAPPPCALHLVLQQVPCT